MRIWDISPEKLCRNHLLGEHRELHAVWSILTKEKAGYARHPETQRWAGKLNALYLRHEKLVTEMTHRGYRHQSPLDFHQASGENVQGELIDSLEKQKEILKKKKCGCRV
jgi:hypothetical protein